MVKSVVTRAGGPSELDVVRVLLRRCSWEESTKLQRESSSLKLS